MKVSRKVTAAAFSGGREMVIGLEEVVELELVGARA